VDGGPDDSVLRSIGEDLPFYARSFDMVIAMAQTPQNVGGLSSVLSRYIAPVILRTAARSNAPQVQPFTEAVSRAQQRGARLLIAARGDVIDLGSGAFMEVLFPDRDASQMSASDGCLMFKLIFGNSSFFFSCGSPQVETYLATLDGERLKADVLLATGNETELFAGYVSPQFAVIPCGATSTVFSMFSIQTIDTCNETLTFLSDGQSIVRQ